MMLRVIRILLAACLVNGTLVLMTAWGHSPHDLPDEKKDKSEKTSGTDDDDEWRRQAETVVKRIEVECCLDEQWVKVKRIEKALLYYADPTRGHTRGSVWAWGEKGRPVVILELWHNGSNRTNWVHGLCNTSGGKVRATRDGKRWWRENNSSSELKDVPGASAPAADSAQRQRQLKALAQKFTGHESGEPVETRLELRRLERPLQTYRDETVGLLEGGMYVLANGTNPELMLFIEAHVKPGAKTESVWQFTVGRMSHCELFLDYDGQEVFQGPRGRPLSGADKPYWVVSASD